MILKSLYLLTSEQTASATIPPEKSGGISDCDDSEVLCISYPASRLVPPRFRLKSQVEISDFDDSEVLVFPNSEVLVLPTSEQTCSATIPPEGGPTERC
jgi:hypothetical protein